MPTPQRVLDRLSAGLKRFQPVLETAKQRDVNEADTVVIIRDMLADLWGYDRYAEVTGEHAIRGTYCDLAIQIGEKPVLLVEVKAVGIDLKDQHVRQVRDYAANKGIDWVALTNGWHWHVYRVSFTKPVETHLVVEFEIPDMSPRSAEDLESLYFLSREGMHRSALEEYDARRQASDKFLLTAVILSDPVLQVIRRELRRVNSGILIEAGDIRAELCTGVLKREVVEGEKATEAAARVAEAGAVALRTRGKGSEDTARDGGTGGSAPERAEGEETRYRSP